MVLSRTISALIFCSVFLVGMYWAPLSFVVPAAAVFGAIVGTDEYCHLARARGHRPGLWVAWLTALALTAWGATTAPGFASVPAVPLAIFAGALVVCGAVFVGRGRPENSIADMAVTFFAGVVVGLPMGLALALWNGAPTRAEGSYLLLFVIGATWVADTAAFFVGRAFGRRRLAPVLSPKKSVEGLLGGFAATFAFAALLHWAPMPGRGVLSLADSLVLAALYCFLGPVGDLTISINKRDASIKDSGVNFTGHGGVLDVIDSLLFTVSATYLYLFATRFWMG